MQTKTVLELNTKRCMLTKPDIYDILDLDSIAVHLKNFFLEGDMRLLLLLVYALLATQGWAAEVTHTVNWGTMAWVSWVTQEGCKVSETFVLTWETTSFSTGKPVKDTFVYANVTVQPDVCSAPGVFSLNTSGSVNGGVQFSARGTQVNTPVLTYDVVAGVNGLVQVNLTWTVTGPPSNSGWHSNTLSNGTRIVSRGHDKTWSTSVVGQVGGTSVPSGAQSLLSTVNYGTITITK
jgi:hypothetical protein